MTVPPLRAANKRKQIDQVVRYLEERLRELDEEKEELKKYQQLDKQRRSLEYTILDHELNDARNELASVRPAISVNFYTFLDAIFILLQQVEIIWIDNEGIGFEFDDQTIDICYIGQLPDLSETYSDGKTLLFWRA